MCHSSVLPLKSSFNGGKVKKITKLGTSAFLFSLLRAKVTFDCEGLAYTLKAKLTTQGSALEDVACSKGKGEK